ncbi:hypothetical protein B0H10DRAFT_1962155 [Mycena sp. CBHHK59/15]|nr:hypothetical protein B0H10DRAFT_1962155 [Mycena sp. CBHHK59/15]
MAVLMHEDSHMAKLELAQPCFLTHLSNDSEQLSKKKFKAFGPYLVTISHINHHIYNTHNPLLRNNGVPDLFLVFIFGLFRMFYIRNQRRVKNFNPAYPCDTNYLWLMEPQNVL